MDPAGQDIVCPLLQITQNRFALQMTPVHLFLVVYDVIITQVVINAKENISDNQTTLVLDALIVYWVVKVVTITIIYRI